LSGSCAEVWSVTMSGDAAREQLGQHVGALPSRPIESGFPASRVLRDERGERVVEVGGLLVEVAGARRRSMRLGVDIDASIARRRSW
jgi:hypothetical protein